MTCGRVDIEEAKRLANGYAKNGRGQYCMSAFTLFDVDIGLTNIEGNTHNLCLPERGQAYVDAIVLDSRCNQTDFFMSAEYVTNLCSVDDSGTICGFTYSNADSEVELESLNSICATSNVSCTSNCQDSISNAKMLRGYCLNWINSSSYTPQALSYGVWKSCGVESPGFCESPLSLSGTATSIMKENHLNILLIIIIAGLIYQYINFMGQ